MSAVQVGSVEVEHDAWADIYLRGDEVILDANEKWGEIEGHAELTLTPEEAVTLSRALVKAAAEALGVSV